MDRDAVRVDRVVRMGALDSRNLSRSSFLGVNLLILGHAVSPCDRSDDV